MTYTLNDVRPTRSDERCDAEIVGQTVTVRVFAERNWNDRGDVWWDCWSVVTFHGDWTAIRLDGFEVRGARWQACRIIAREARDLANQYDC